MNKIIKNKNYRYKINNNNYKIIYKKNNNQKIRQRI